MTKLITRKQSFDVFLIYLLLFVSGSHVFRLMSDKFLILLLMFLFAAWYLSTDRKIDLKFVLYLVVFTSFLFIVSLYTAGSLQLSSVIGTVVKLLIAYLIVKMVGARFFETYINVVVFLAVVSLFGYLTDTFHLFSGLITKLPRVGNIGYEGFFYVFRFREHIDRNNSIFFEPGAYQIFLNTGLFFLLFAKTNFSASRKWTFISVLLITLFTTFSTTGFLIFAVMFGLFLLKGDALSASGKATLIGVVSIALLVFSAQFSTVIFKKIETYLGQEHLTDSHDRRSFDMLVDLEIFKKHIFGVGYEEYTKEFSAIGLVGEGTGSSNGITKLLAIYGLPFGLFFLASYFWALHKLLDGFLLAIGSFGMLVMFLIGESYYVFAPFCLALIAAPFVYKTSEENETNGREAEPVSG